MLLYVHQFSTKGRPQNIPRFDFPAFWLFHNALLPFDTSLSSSRLPLRVHGHLSGPNKLYLRFPLDCRPSQGRTIGYNRIGSNGESVLIWNWLQLKYSLPFPSMQSPNLRKVHKLVLYHHDLRLEDFLGTLLRSLLASNQHLKTNLNVTQSTRYIQLLRIISSRISCQMFILWKDLIAYSLHCFPKNWRQLSECSQDPPTETHWFPPILCLKDSFLGSPPRKIPFRLL